MFRNRWEAMERFAKMIPHSVCIYNVDTIYKAQNEYDLFVVGSDQVWNPQFYDPTYFCNFVKNGKKCIAYAASISKNNLSEEEKETFRSHLKGFQGISLRENDIQILQQLTETPVFWVLDPTLLLEKSEWDNISSNKIICERYVFCYFLGYDSVERKLAQTYAERHNLKLVFIPYASGYYSFNEEKMKGISVPDASVEEFISLIKNADYVFTDSFHASVFSHIYQKEFFVFRRKDSEGMSSRIYSLLELFGTENRFCDGKERTSIEYLESLDRINYSNECVKIKKKKEESINFLEKWLVEN